MRSPRLRRVVFVCLVALRLAVSPGTARGAEVVRYTLAIRDTATQTADLSGRIPTSGEAVVELMMPVWSPGFYRVEDYAGKVQGLEVTGEDGTELRVTQPKPNIWRVEAGKRSRLLVSYRLLCDRGSVTTNEITKTYAVLNPAATFLMPRRAVQARAWPFELTLELPRGWTALSALPSLKRDRPWTFKSSRYETLVDSPILAGELSTRSFEVEGSVHTLADAGERESFDAEKAAGDLKRIVAETRRFWGFLPFKRYLILNVFRKGGGGLEHKDSTLLTSSAARVETPEAYRRWLGFVAHEYFHAFNAKRLRPVELGPFDFDHPPQTSSLWITEGLTTYFADLMVRRAGLSTREDFLERLSGQIRDLQGQAGRLVQTVEESSLGVWDNSLSGIRPTEKTVSYYVKGDILGFVLDARIRKATNGRQSIDDLIRLAYKRYSGERGFTPAQFQAAASEVAGADLSGWFHLATASTEEVDYAETLDWFGLRFLDPSDPERPWSLVVRDEATPEQRLHLAAWLDGL